MKVKRMGITEILRRIWLFSANKIRSSESFSKQPTQLIHELNSSLRQIIVTYVRQVWIMSGKGSLIVWYDDSVLIIELSSIVTLTDNTKKWNIFYYFLIAFEINLSSWNCSIKRFCELMFFLIANQIAWNSEWKSRLLHIR